jgi:lipopolysaccharide heptosyltransferase II
MRVFNPQKLRYARLLDSLGRFVFGVLKPRTASEPAPLSQIEPQRIVVCESHLVGDIVMAIPALRALRARHPASKITLVSGPWGRELLENQGVVDEFAIVRFPWATYDYSYANVKAMILALFKLRKARFDLGIDMRGDIRNIAFLFFTRAKRRVGYNFTGGEYLLTDVIHDTSDLRHIVDHNVHIIGRIGCTVDSMIPDLRISEAEIDSARELLRMRGGLGKKLTIGIHPGASKPQRKWKHDRFARLADLFLEDHENRVLILQGPQDEEIVKKIAGAMKYKPLVVSLPLRQLPPVLHCCEIVIGLDSGIVHIAAATGVPTVVLFGPAEPNRVKPFSPHARIVIKEGYSCRPCDQVHCVQPTNNCMDAISVDSVYSCAIELIGARGCQKAVRSEYRSKSTTT